MKQYGFETFKRQCKRWNREITIICFTENTRSGFKHVAVVENLSDWNEKVNYSNRTWESYKYETVLDRLMSKIEEM